MDFEHVTLKELAKAFEENGRDFWQEVKEKLYDDYHADKVYEEETFRR